MPHHALPFLSFLDGANALDLDPALCDDASEKWMNYGSLRTELKKLLPIWHAHPRGLVLCAAPRTIHGALSYLSAAAAGHALLMCDETLPRLDSFIAAYEPDWILLPSALRPGEAYARIDWPYDELFLWHRAKESDAPLHPDLFLLLLPPGPPDSRRTVRLSYANISANTMATIAALGLGKNARALLHLPLSYSFGLAVLHTHLAVGATVVLTELDIKNRAFWNLAAQRQITHFPGIPFHFEYIARAGLEHLHVPLVKTFLQAGGRMPPERTQDILRQIEARQGAFFFLYGQTEAAPRMAVLPLHERPEKIASIGHAIEGTRFEADGARLTFIGPNVMMGTAERRADLAAGDEMKGRLPLHDTGHIDAEGFVFIEGK